MEEDKSPKKLKLSEEDRKLFGKGKPKKKKMGKHCYQSFCELYPVEFSKFLETYKIPERPDSNKYRLEYNRMKEYALDKYGIEFNGSIPDLVKNLHTRMDIDKLIKVRSKNRKVIKESILDYILSNDSK